MGAAPPRHCSHVGRMNWRELVCWCSACSATWRFHGTDQRNRRPGWSYIGNLAGDIPDEWTNP